MVMSENTRIRNVQEEISTNISYYKNVAYNEHQDVIIIFDLRAYEIYLGEKKRDKFGMTENFSFSSKKIGFKYNGVTKYSGTVYLSYKDKNVAKLIFAPVTGLYRWQNI